MAHSILLSLGTNLCDRLQNLQNAVEHLHAELQIEAISKVYETPPWGKLDQPAFFNAVIQATGYLTARETLEFIKQIEQQLGRESAEKWGPRLIDIDILFFDDEMIDEDNLTIPHRFVAERGFVLVPLNDIAPDYRHPKTNQTVANMLAAVSVDGILPTNHLLTVPEIAA